MATKFLDHGAYGAGSVTASTTNGSASLNVTAVASGIISIGSEVVGSGIPANAIITSLGTGLGGTGTYTMSLNATATASGVSVACKYAYPLTIPLTWALPQEGDGTLAAASTASATVSVDMSAWTFTSGSSTFSVMGCTALTIGAGANSATNAQYSATYATMLANIVAAINLATASTVNIPATWTSTNVRSTVFARVNGNNLELMTRSGSASWNSLVALAFSNVTGSSSQSWAGGVSGCWGHFANGVTSMWPVATVAGTYGPMSSAGVFAGVMAAGDVVEARSGRVVYFSAWASNVTLTLGVGGTKALPTTFRVDDGNTVSAWTGDADFGLFTLAHVGLYDFNINGNNAGYQRVVGKRNGSVRTLRVVNYGNTNNNTRLSPARGTYWESVEVSTSVSTNNVAINDRDTDSNGETYLRDIKLAHPTTSPFFVHSGYAHSLRIDGLELDNTGCASANLGVISRNTSGVLRIGDTRYTYSGRTGATFSGVSPSPSGATGAFYVPLIDDAASGTTIASQAITYAADINVVYRVRKYATGAGNSILPFENVGVVGSSDVSFAAVRTVDPVAT